MIHFGFPHPKIGILGKAEPDLDFFIHILTAKARAINVLKNLLVMLMVRILQDERF